MAVGGGFEKLGTVSEALTRPRTVTVRLHFAEPGDARPGDRVFDVKLQGQTVLRDLDPVREAGGRGTAVVREIPSVEVSRAVMLEFVPKPGVGGVPRGPVVSGVEVLVTD